MGFDYPLHCDRYCEFKENEKFIRKYGGDKYIARIIRMPENEAQEKEYMDIMKKIYSYHLNLFEVRRC